MSKETLEELKMIHDNAPDGSNFVEDSVWNKGLRYFLRDEFQWFGISNVCTHRLHELPCFTRSLSDIDRIIELEEKLRSFADDIGDCDCIGGVAKTLREYGL